MENKKSPKGRKRSAKSGSSAAATTTGNTNGVNTAEDGTWDCSVCTFRNNAEAFKCSMCDVRKGTSTRKPRLNPDLVASQQAQAITPPPPPFPCGETSVLISSPIPSSSSKSETIDAPEEEAAETGPDLTPPLSAPKVLKKPMPSPSTSSSKKSEAKKAPNKARLKNVDRTSATYHSVTVDDFTVVITEFKPKAKKEKKEKISSNATPGSSSDTSCQGPPSITELASSQINCVKNEPSDQVKPTDTFKEVKKELETTSGTLVESSTFSSKTVTTDHQSTVEDTAKPSVDAVNDTGRSS